MASGPTPTLALQPASAAEHAHLRHGGLGFGRSDQPQARLKDEAVTADAVHYGFDLWGQQVADFCDAVVQRPVRLVGNSIGGVVALRAAQLLGDHCRGVVLIDCAQRLMDDKQLATQPAWMAWIRPLQTTVAALAQHCAVPQCGTAQRDPQRVEAGLSQWRQHRRRPGGSVVPTHPTDGAAEAFRGFINLFDDYLAPQLMEELKLPVI